MAPAVLRQAFVHFDFDIVSSQLLLHVCPQHPIGNDYTLAVSLLQMVPAAESGL
jgi:hypothetical protein